MIMWNHFSGKHRKHSTPVHPPTNAKLHAPWSMFNIDMFDSFYFNIHGKEIDLEISRFYLYD